jgi:hypothetical protein
MRGLPAYLRSDLTHATRGGLMSEEQYSYVAAKLLAAPGSLLVFGLGHDADLWRQCTPGSVAFVEDDVKYLALAPIAAQVLLYKYPSRVGVWSDVPKPPALFNRPWDYVLVDGPAGYSPSSPGRQISLTWARQLARRLVFVHDYQRPWEREVCNRVLGSPIERVKPPAGRRGDLAVFDVQRQAPRAR